MGSFAEGYRDKLREIRNDYHSNATPEEVEELIDGIKQGNIKLESSDE